MFEARVFVSPKEGILDPQGNAVASALQSLGYTNTAHVRVGKYITLTVDAATEAEATKELKEMCDKLLTNPLIEQYRFELQRQ